MERKRLGRDDARGAGMPGTRSRTHRVSNGEYHRVKTTQVRFVFGGQVPERHVRGTGTVVVAVIRHGDGAHVTGVGTSRLSPFENRVETSFAFSRFVNDVF